MSAAVLMAPSGPRRLRSVERTAMTPEEELELLIAEQQRDEELELLIAAQQRDDTYFVDRPPGEISLDAPTPDGSGTIGDLIGVDDDGEIHVFRARRLDESNPKALGGGHALLDPRSINHGTIYAYRRQECRCVPCKAAQAKAVREYRARKRNGQ